MKFGWIPGLRQPLAQLAAICLLVAGCSHAEPEYTQQALSVKGGKTGSWISRRECDSNC
jgi:hypothetical protein